MAQFVAHHQRVMRFGKLAALSGQNSTRRRFVIIGKPSRKALMGSHSLLAIAAAVALCACNRDAREEQGAASAPIHVYRATGKAVSAELTGYNHTDQTIAAFYVNGQWGGNIFPGTGGGKFVCCVRLPAQWHEGLVVQVTWEDHELKPQSREVAVPRYEAADVADFNVHFLRGGNIKVFATRGGLRSRDYPLVGPESELKPGVPIEKGVLTAGPAIRTVPLRAPTADRSGRNGLQRRSAVACNLWAQKAAAIGHSAPAFVAATRPAP